MKKSALGVGALSLLLSVQQGAAQDIATTGTETKSQLKAKAPAASAKSVFQVDIKGMSCMSCVANVKRTLSRIEGVDAVEVNLAPGEAIVAGSSRVTTETLVSEINKLGYKASPKARQIDVE